MRINVKDISGKWLTVENEAARLNLPIYDPLTGKGYVIAGTAVYQQSDNKVYTYDGTQWKVLEGGGGGGSADLESQLDVTEPVGGIDDGKQYSTGTSLETILRDMLNPTVNPDITAPSASISGGTPYILEIGTSKNVNFTINFDKGKIHPLYGTEPLVDADRAGDAEEYKLNGGTAQVTNTFTNITVDKDNATFVANVKYAASSVQPKDSKGNNYLTPLASGNVNTATLTYSFTNTVWSNVADITDIRKIEPTTIKYSDKQATLEFPAATIANPETFDVPSSWSVTSITYYNSFTQSWDDVAFEFSVTTTTHLDAGGETVSYNRYTYNKGIPIDNRNVKITWN